MQRGSKPTRKKGPPAPSAPDVKLPKIAKLTMPEDFKIRTHPLFSLPEEVLKLPSRPQKKNLSTPVKPRRRSSGKTF